MGIKEALRFFFRRGVEILVLVLLITFLPNLPPHVDIKKPYIVKPTKPLQDKLALNERLNNAEIWHKGELNGPEAFTDFNGELYTSLNGGDIVKLAGEHIIPVAKFGKPCKGLYQERLCGRPLGMDFSKDGSLFVCDAYYGVFKVDIKTGNKVQLVPINTEIDGKNVKLPNGLAVASNGDIYWSDSSSEFGLEDGVFDFLSDGSGRLIHYNAKTKKNKILLDGLLFANGVALSDDDEFVVVSESGKSRLHRCFLKGSKQGKCEIFIDGLPGLPDNVKTDGRSGFLVSLIVPIDKDYPAFTQVLGPFPLIRRFLVRALSIIELSFKLVNRAYPNEYAEKAMHFIGHFRSFSFTYSKHRYTLVQVSKNGEIIDSFHALDGKISSISEAHIFKDYIYLGSPFNDYIARVSLFKIGLKSPIAKQTQQEAEQMKPPTINQNQVPIAPKPTASPKTTQIPSTTPIISTQALLTTKEIEPPPVTQNSTVSPKTVTTQKPIVTQAKEVPVQVSPHKKDNSPLRVGEVPLQVKETKNIPPLAKDASLSPQVKEILVQTNEVNDSRPLVKESSSSKVNEVPMQVKSIEKEQIILPVKKTTSKQENPKKIHSKTSVSDRSETNKDNFKVTSAKGTR